MQFSFRRELLGRGLRVVAGWARLGAWAILLWAVVAPWSQLGGLVDERLRWLERVVLSGGLLGGLTVGGFARDACRPGGRFTHARWLRWLVWPALALAAAGLVVFEAVGQEDAGGVWLTSMLAWCAGLDVALAAWPLVCGRDYRGGADLRDDPDELDDLDDLDGDPTDRAIF